MGYIDKAVRQIRVLSPAEQKKLLDTTGAHVEGLRDHMIYSYALGTGLREHELTALNVGDVWQRGRALTKITIRTFKGSGRSRAPETQTVFASRLIARKLPKFIAWKKRQGESLEPGAPLFCSRSGDRIATRTLRHQFKTWQTRAEIEPAQPFHALRHSSMTNLYRATKDLRVVQRQARHKNVTTTQIYTHVSDEDVARAVGGLPS